MLSIHHHSYRSRHLSCTSSPLAFLPYPTTPGTYLRDSTLFCSDSKQEKGPIFSSLSCLLKQFKLHAYGTLRSQRFTGFHGNLSGTAVGFRASGERIKVLRSLCSHRSRVSFRIQGPPLASAREKAPPKALIGLAGIGARAAHTHSHTETVGSNEAERLLRGRRQLCCIHSPS